MQIESPKFARQVGQWATRLTLATGMLLTAGEFTPVSSQQLPETASVRKLEIGVMAMTDPTKSSLLSANNLSIVLEALNGPGNLDSATELVRKGSRDTVQSRVQVIPADGSAFSIDSSKIKNSEGGCDQGLEVEQARSLASTFRAYSEINTLMVVVDKGSGCREASFASLPLYNVFLHPRVIVINGLEIENPKLNVLLAHELWHVLGLAHSKTLTGNPSQSYRDYESSEKGDGVMNMSSNYPNMVQQIQLLGGVQSPEVAKSGISVRQISAPGSYVLECSEKVNWPKINAFTIPVPDLEQFGGTYFLSCDESGSGLEIRISRDLRRKYGELEYYLFPETYKIVHSGGPGYFKVDSQASLEGSEFNQVRVAKSGNGELRIEVGNQPPSRFLPLVNLRRMLDSN